MEGVGLLQAVSPIRGSSQGRRRRTLSGIVCCVNEAVDIHRGRIGEILLLGVLGRSHPAEQLASPLILSLAGNKRGSLGSFANINEKATEIMSRLTRNGGRINGLPARVNGEVSRLGISGPGRRRLVVHENVHICILGSLADTDIRILGYRHARGELRVLNPFGLGQVAVDLSVIIWKRLIRMVGIGSGLVDARSGEVVGQARLRRQSGVGAHAGSQYQQQQGGNYAVALFPLVLHRSLPFENRFPRQRPLPLPTPLPCRYGRRSLACARACLPAGSSETTRSSTIDAATSSARTATTTSKPGIVVQYALTKPR